MSKFPLYTSLMLNLSTKDLTIPQKKKLITIINTLNEEAYELIYILIKCYYTEHNRDMDSLALPYNGQICSDGINFNLNELPNQLKQLLFKFVQLHLRKIQEDRENEERQAAMSSVPEN